MGLDITCCRQLSEAKNVAVHEDGEPVEWDQIVWIDAQTLEWAEACFPGRSDGLKAGYYHCKETAGFKAGSYSDYNQWRDELERLVYGGLDTDKRTPPSPFAELLNFADNEGYIGPVTSAKLAKDFAEHEARIAAASGDEEWFLPLYRKWRDAFEMAADGGCVEFH